MSNDTMHIWNKVSKTNPNETKQVSHGRKFTAIDAYSQIEDATKLWGPIGQGWGFHAEHSTIFPDAKHVQCIAVCDLTLWYGKPGENQIGPVRTMCPVIGRRKNGDGDLFLDDDAAKKALTDGLTKCLSYLGFNADVFLGKFDDNKYVEQRRAEAGKEAAIELNRLKATIIQQLGNCRSNAYIDELANGDEMTRFRNEASDQEKIEMSKVFQKRRKDVDRSFSDD